MKTKKQKLMQSASECVGQLELQEVIKKKKTEVKILL